MRAGDELYVAMVAGATRKQVDDVYGYALRQATREVVDLGRGLDSSLLRCVQGGVGRRAALKAREAAQAAARRLLARVVVRVVVRTTDA